MNIFTKGFNLVKSFFLNNDDDKEETRSETMTSTPSSIIDKNKGAESLDFKVGEGLGGTTKLAPGPTKTLHNLPANEKVEFVAPDKEGKRIKPKLSQKIQAKQVVGKNIEKAQDETTLGQNVKKISKNIPGQLFSFAKQKIKEDLDRTPVERVKHNLAIPYNVSKEILKFIPKIPGFAARQIDSAFLSIADPDAQITPAKNLQFALGEEPIKSFQKRYGGTYDMVKELGATDDQARNLAVIGVGLSTWADLSAGGGKKKAEQSLMKEIEKYTGDKATKEFIETEAKRIAKLPFKDRQTAINQTIADVLDDGSDAFKFQREARLITDMEHIGKEVESEIKKEIPLTSKIQTAKAEGKSFEEFTKGQQQVFRGGSVFDPKKIGDDGISLTTSSERAKFFTSETQGKGGEKGRIVQEFFIDKKVNIAQQKDIPVNLWKTIEPDDISKWAKENKFDGVDLRNLGGSIAQADKEIRIFNPAIIKTKSQLKQLWDKGITKDINKIGSIGLNKFDVPKETKDSIIKIFKDSGIEKDMPQSEKGWLKLAKESEVLQNAMSPGEVKAANARLIKTEQRIADIGKQLTEATDPEKRGALLRESIDLARVTNEELSARGRLLRAAGTKVDDESVVNSLIKRMTKQSDDVEGMIREGKNVDFNNQKEVTEFYRKFVKPTFSEVFTEYRYNNMLSSPRTLERNLISNIVQTIVTRPSVKLTEATIDAFIAPLTGKAREAFFKDVPKYYYGLLKSVPEAFEEFKAVMQDRRVFGQQDLKEVLGQMPTNKLPGFMRIPSKVLESTDRFLQNLIAGGEVMAGKSNKEAARIAENSLFRSGLDVKNKKGQGRLLSGVDNVTSKIDSLRKLPGGTWFVPFLRTPMNFAKMWLEYSPAGLLGESAINIAKGEIPLSTMARKKEQIAKMMIGSTITAYGAKLAWDGDTTWGAPSDPEAKKLFYASGRKPFSVRIGDRWLPMIYLGPWAFALALPAAIKYNHDESPNALTDSGMKKVAKNISALAQFYSQQTFMSGVGSFVDLINKEPDTSIEKSLAFTVGQIIPFQGLVRYTSTITDDVYRKANGFLEALESGIPYMSKDLEPHTLPTGELSRRNIYSYLAPYDISQHRQEFDNMFKLRNQELQSNSVRNELDKDKKRKALEIIQVLNISKDDDEILKALKIAGDDPSIKNAVKSMLKKQAEYNVGTIQPYVILEPRDRAELVHTKLLMTKEGGAESEQEVIDLMTDLKENDMWGEEERSALKDLLKKYPLE